MPRLSAALDNEYVRVYISVGDIQHAQDTFDRHSGSMATGSDGISMAIRHYQIQMHARILGAQHHYDEAFRSLSAIRDESTRVGWRRAEVVNSLELARAKTLGGDTDEATELLASTLVTAERAGLVRTVVDGGRISSGSWPICVMPVEPAAGRADCPRSRPTTCRGCWQPPMSTGRRRQCRPSHVLPAARR